MKWTPTARRAFALRMKRARGTRRIRRKNPSKFRVVIKAKPLRGGSILYYDGKHLSANKTKRKYFSSVVPAKIVALSLLRNYPVLRAAYRLTLNAA